jgi:glycosyltransferase involved in cell wall biosynthesis
MRIVIAGYHPADPARILGGVEAITLRLAEGLAEAGGHEIHVVTTRPEIRRPEILSPPGRTVHLLPRSRLLGNITLMWRDRRQLGRLFRHLVPDVIHAHSTSEFALAALESGYPTVVSVHGIAREEARLARGAAERLRGLARTRLEALVLRRVRDVMVVSPYVADRFGGYFRHARTHTVETSVSDLFFRVERRPLPETALFAGLIIPRKGVVELVEAARLLRARRPGVRVRLAGAETDPAYAERVRSAIAAAGLGEAVTLLGGLSADALAQELARATLLVLPSFQETAPIAIQEAMAAGVPVVATDVGGNRHLVSDRETGRLVASGDTEELARAIDWVLEDASRAAALGETARREARDRFAPLAVARRSIMVYEEVRARGGGAM